MLLSLNSAVERLMEVKYNYQAFTGHIMNRALGPLKLILCKIIFVWSTSKVKLSWLVLGLNL